MWPLNSPDSGPRVNCVRKERPKPLARGARRAGRSLGATGGGPGRGENALCPEGRLCTRSFPVELRKGTHATSPSSHGNRRPLERRLRSAPGSANYAASSPWCADPRPHPRGLPRRRGSAPHRRRRRSAERRGSHTSGHLVGC